MSLTDQEQVILRAIDRVRHGDVALIADVIKAVGYPKATTKKVLARLNKKGIVALHRHDYPQSLTSAQRKLMIRLKDGQGRWHYFTAVSVMKRNPKGKHLRGATAKQERQYEHILESAKEYGRYGKRKKEVAARTVRKRQNPQKSGKGKKALRRTGRALKGAARGLLASGAEILASGAEALNPTRRIKIRNKYIDLVIKGQAKKTPDGWKVGKKTFAQGQGAVNVSSGYYLDRATGIVYARRERNKAKKKAGKKNAPRASRQRKASSSRRHRVANKTGRRANASRKVSTTVRRKSPVKARKAATKRDSNNPTRKGMRKGYREAKRISKITRGRYFSSELGQRKAARHEKKHARKSKRNPSAESIRKKFAGRVSGERDVFVPASAPKGKLAKLGNLVLIQTEQGTIKPVHGSAILLADTRGKLHVGSLSGAPLFDGPRRSFGEVKRIEYDDSKPHLGFPNPIIWHHRLGEETGHRPTLHADGQGGLVFRGGRYRLTRRGIEN